LKAACGDRFDDAELERGSGSGIEKPCGFAGTVDETMS
jgi:hypothetical protein